MLLPQFSIRSLLLLTAVAGAVSLVLQQAVAGAAWAQCAGWTFVFLAALLVAYAILFLLAYGLGQISGEMRPHYTPVATPFAPAGFVRPEDVPVNPFAPGPDSPGPPAAAP